MGRKPKGHSEPMPTTRRSRPAKTLEARENQLIALAMDVAEEQMRNGTVSSQVLSKFIESGTVKSQLEKEKLRHEVVLIEAKVETMKSAKTTEELYTKALEAMRSYTGTPVETYEN
jgi:TRAP-type uncharacterized transport system substrate-binding protein